MEITEEQRQRTEANRLAALAKRKALQQSATTASNRQDAWRLSKCRKFSTEPAHFPKSALADPNSTTQLPENFRVRLEICSPDSFSVTPLAIEGFVYPREEECLRRLGQWLSDVSFISSSFFPPYWSMCSSWVVRKCKKLKVKEKGRENVGKYVELLVIVFYFWLSIVNI